MTTEPNYSVTPMSVTVVWEGRTYTVQRSSPNYPGLRKSILEKDWDSIPKFLTVGKSIQSWAKGKFTVGDGDVISYEGSPLPNSLNQRIINMTMSGEDPTILFNFWERLQKNPSFRSVEQLWTFLQHEGIPFTPDGCFLAYKAVKKDYTDQYTGTVKNTPGTINEMPRNRISDDPKNACDHGFHVGALNYATNFKNTDGRIVICKVDPEHVVCVPYDSSAEKMRVSRYEVMGNYGVQLPSTTFKEDHEDELKDWVSRAAYKDDDDNDDDDDEDENEFRAVVLPGQVPIPEPSEVKEEEPEEKIVKVPKGFAKLHKMDMAGLLKQSIEILRSYASKGLKIVGASKIPGGKPALIARILEVRR